MPQTLKRLSMLMILLEVDSISNKIKIIFFEGNYKCLNNNQIIRWSFCLGIGYY